MGLTEIEVRGLAEQHPGAAGAYRDAVMACVSYIEAVKRHNAKPGFWSELRVGRREVDLTRFAARLHETYGAITGETPDASDVDSIMSIIRKRAELIVEQAELEKLDRQMYQKAGKAMGMDL